MKIEVLSMLIFLRSQLSSCLEGVIVPEHQELRQGRHQWRKSWKQNEGQDESPEKSSLSLNEAVQMEGEFWPEEFL